MVNVYKNGYRCRCMKDKKRKITTPPANTVVMIVDDMQSIRMITRTAVASMGFSKFIECSNGQEALTRLKNIKVDLVICDWDMPEMNGLELLTEMRADKEMANTAFIMLTGHTETELIHQCITAGVNSYIVKPYQPAILCKRINELLEQPVAIEV